MPASANLRSTVPTAQNRAVRPSRRPNRDYRSREYLTEHEVDSVIAAARGNRHGPRDATMMLVAYRHGLRASEVCDLRWDQIDFAAATLHVQRVKNGKPGAHPIRGDELRALRKLQRQSQSSAYVFVTERGAPFAPDGFRWLVRRAGTKAGLPFSIHPHMLRHACGYALANRGHETRALQDWLGHRSIVHTVRYSELAPGKFRNFWR
jgi:integrase